MPGIEAFFSFLKEHIDAFDDHYNVNKCSDDWYWGLFYNLTNKVFLLHLIEYVLNQIKNKYPAITDDECEIMVRNITKYANEKICVELSHVDESNIKYTKASNIKHIKWCIEELIGLNNNCFGDLQQYKETQSELQ